MTGESKKEKDIWSDGEFGKEKDNSGKCLCDIRNNKLSYEDSNTPHSLEARSMEIFIAIHGGALIKGISACTFLVVDSGLHGLTD